MINKYHSVIEFGRPAGVIINYYNVINLKVIIKNHKSNIGAPIPIIPIGLIYNIDLLGLRAAVIIIYHTIKIYMRAAKSSELQSQASCEF